MMCGRACLLTVLGLFLVACGGGGGGGGGGGQAPTGLSVFQGSTFDTVVVTWDEPAGKFPDGYELEGRMGDEPFEKLHAGLIDGDVIGIEAELLSSTPELQLFTLRLRAIFGGTPTDYSNEATYIRGLRPVENFSAQVHQTETLQLTWTQASQAVESIHIQRAEQDVPQDWYKPYEDYADLPPDTTTFVDDQVLVGLKYKYLIQNEATFNAQPVASSSVEAIPAGTPGLLPPSNLVAVLEEGGVRISWDNSSIKADTTVVYRADGLEAPQYQAIDELTELTADLLEYFDPREEGELGTYWAVNVAPEGAEAESDPLSVVVPPSSAGLPLTYQILHMPVGTAVDRDSLSRFAFSVGGWFHHYQTNSMRLHVPDLDDWREVVLVDWDDSLDQDFALPDILVDGSDTVHSVYGIDRDAPVGEPKIWDIYYGNSAGGGWSEESPGTVVVSPTYCCPLFWFGVSDDATPHLLWKNYGSGFPVHAVKNLDSWNVGDLTSALYNPDTEFPQFNFTVGNSGTAFVSGVLPDKVILQHLPAGGSWAEEVATLSAAPHYNYPTVLTAGVDTDAHLFFTSFDLSDDIMEPQSLAHVARRDGVWSTVEEVARSAETYRFDKATTSSDGSRVAMLNGTTLHVRNVDGQWHKARLAWWMSSPTDPPHDAKWVGFTEGGLIEALVPAGSVVDGYRPYLLYVETQP